MQPGALIDDAARIYRARIDQGVQLLSAARTDLARYCRRILSRAPTDEAGNDAVRRLAERAMEPPRRGRLPDHASGAEVREWLERWSEPERREVASDLLTLPEIGADWQVMEVAAEVLLAGHDPRANTLAETLCEAPGVSDTARSFAELWRFRWRLGGTDAGDETAVEACLDALREPHVLPVHLGEALVLAAAASIEDSHVVGADWMVPCFGGRQVCNVALSLLRRPALRDELAGAFAWMEEAAALWEGPRGEACSRLRAAESADRAGNLALATEHAREALALSAERDDVRHAIAMRRHVLGTDLQALGGHDGDAAIDDFSTHHGDAPTELTTAPVRPPNSGWSQLLESLTEPPVSDPSLLGFLEAAGSRRRAAQGWLKLGGLMGFLHAFRLRDAMTEAMRDALLGGLEAAIVDDEVALAGDPLAIQAATALRSLLEHRGRHLEGLGWRLRLAAVAAAGERPSPDPPQMGSSATRSEDPHSVTNRLAAAEELVSAGRLEAAATVVVALLKHVATPDDRRTLVAISRELLSATSVSPAFVGAVERLIASGEADVERKRTSKALMDALIASPMMAYPLHASLYRAAAEAEDLTDFERLRRLEAWLGIWRATATPPALDAVRKLARNHLALLAMAAFRLAGDIDPVGSARDFIARYPTRTTSASTLSDALLTASTS